jgi:hypothetical protein
LVRTNIAAVTETSPSQRHLFGSALKALAMREPMFTTRYIFEETLCEVLQKTLKKGEKL